MMKHLLFAFVLLAKKPQILIQNRMAMCTVLVRCLGEPVYPTTAWRHLQRAKKANDHEVGHSSIPGPEESSQMEEGVVQPETKSSSINMPILDY